MHTPYDRVEIVDLFNRHQIYIDLKDAERYASIYALDGLYESSFATARGTAALIAMSRELGTSGFSNDKRHFTGPMLIEIDGDRATALSYWWVADYSKNQPTVFATGTYRDTLSKINGQWSIVHRVQEQDSPESAEE